MGNMNNYNTNSNTGPVCGGRATVDDDRGLCPEGWHVTSDNEFTVLTEYLE